MNAGRQLPERIEADEAPLAAMLAWLKEGPSMARVDALDVRERDSEDLQTFEILR